MWRSGFISVLIFSSCGTIEPAQSESMSLYQIARISVNGSEVDETQLSRADHPGLQAFLTTLRQGMDSLDCCDESNIIVNYRSTVVDGISIEADDNVVDNVQDVGEAGSKVCQLSSPWVDAVVTRDGTSATHLNAIFHLDAPTILADQAKLAGLGASGTARPIADAQFMQYAQIYAMALTTGGRGGPDMEALASEIPAHLLWTFSAAPQSTRGPFFSEARHTADRLMERYAGPYADLSLALLGECVQRDRAKFYEIQGLDDQSLQSLRVAGQRFSVFVRRLQSIPNQKG